MMEFLDMGGRGQYLWPAYALTLGVIVMNVIWARAVVREARAEARRRLAIDGGDA
jgi:heme exporter protein CcmD